MFDFSAANPGDTVTNGTAVYLWDGQKWTYPGQPLLPPIEPPGGDGTGLSNNGGVLMVVDSTWPNGPTGVPPGELYSNGGLVMVAGTTTPNPAAPPVYFGSITSSALLALGGADLPLAVGPVGSGQLWNNFQVVEIS